MFSYETLPQNQLDVRETRYLTEQALSEIPPRENLEAEDGNTGIDGSFAFPFLVPREHWRVDTAGAESSGAGTDRLLPCPFGVRQYSFSRFHIRRSSDHPEQSTAPFRFILDRFLQPRLLLDER